MFDEILFDKTFYDAVTFRIKSISGSKIYVRGIGFHFNFDKNKKSSAKCEAFNYSLCKITCLSNKSSSLST